jgi:hypothetical protein
MEKSAWNMGDMHFRLVPHKNLLNVHHAAKENSWNGITRMLYVGSLGHLTIEARIL